MFSTPETSVYSSVLQELSGELRKSVARFVSDSGVSCNVYCASMRRVSVGGAVYATQLNWHLHGCCYTGHGYRSPEWSAPVTGPSGSNMQFPTDTCSSSMFVCNSPLGILS